MSRKLKQAQDQIFHFVALMKKFIDKQMDGQNSLDLSLKDLFGRLAVDVMGSYAFGIECNALKSNEKFMEMCKKFFEITTRDSIRIMLSSYPKLLNLLKFPDVRKDVSDFFLNLILDTMENRRKHGVKRNDTMQLLMELQNSYVDPRFAVGEQDKKILKNEEFDEIDVVSNLFFIFIAGYRMTSSVLNYCFYELALNQDIQDRLRSEIQHLKSEGETNDKNLRQLTYMDAVISETLRKYPPFTILSRMCTEDYVIPGTKTRVTAGTEVIIPVWSIHHDRKHYPNPEVFDPERFLGDSKQSIPNGAYLPFGEGHRYCLGQRFAEMEIKATLAEIVLKFNLKPCSKTEIPLKFKLGSYLLQNQCETWVNIEKRKD